MLLSVSFALIIIIIMIIIIKIKMISIVTVIIKLSLVHESQVSFSRKTNMKFAVQCEIKMEKNRQPTHAVYLFTQIISFKCIY